MSSEPRHILTAFRVAIWAGIAGNLSFAIPAVLAPNVLLSLLGLQPLADPVWLGDAGLLLTFLSLMYVGAAIDPWRYRLNSYLMVIGRLAFVPYWFWPRGSAEEGTAFCLLGVADLVIGAVQLVLLIIIMRGRSELRHP